MHCALEAFNNDEYTQFYHCHVLLGLSALVVCARIFFFFLLLLLVIVFHIAFLNIVVVGVYACIFVCCFYCHLCFQFSWCAFELWLWQFYSVYVFF